MLRLFICSILMFQIGFGASLPALAAASHKADTSADSVHKAVAGAVADPIFEPFANDTTSSLDLDMPRDEASIDQDPFFLRSQAWTKSSKTHDLSDSEDAPTYEFGANDVSIQIPGSKKLWNLKAPVHPVFFTDEYIFLAANADSTIFSDASRGLDEKGEGLFIVSYNDLLSSSVHEVPVPVHFFPMPGHGWQSEKTADVTAFEIPKQSIIAFTNAKGEKLPVALTDIAAVIRGETVNQLLAMSMGFENAFEKLEGDSAKLEGVRKNIVSTLQALVKESQSKAKDPSAGLQNALTKSYGALIAQIQDSLGREGVLLPRGSTAGFGILFTGFDLDHPEKPSVYTTSVAKPQSLIKRLVAALGISSAHAVDPHLAQFMIRTSVLLAKCSFIFIAGVALRYTLLKKKINEREGPKGKNGKSFFDVFAHSLTFLSQVPSVWGPNVIEYFMDRTFPYIGVTENSWVRRFFDYTFGYMRRTSNRTPVNTKTLIYGVGILGGVDTVLVAFQWYLLTPAIGHGLALAFPILASRVHAAWGADNADMAMYNLLSVMGNLIGYITSGAYSYAHDQQDIASNDAARQVSARMKEEGLDPEAEKNKPEFDRRVKQIVLDKLKQQELPDDKEFLFDANTVYRSMQTFFGYSISEEIAKNHNRKTTDIGVPLAAAETELPTKEAKFDAALKHEIEVHNDLYPSAVENQKIFYDVEAPLKELRQTVEKVDALKAADLAYFQDSENFKGITRQGLMIPAVGRALKAAEAQYKTSGAEADLEAVNLLKGVRNDLSLFRAFLKSPSSFMSPSSLIDVSQRFRKVRHELVAFTFVGAKDEAIVDMPASWIERSPVGAKAAAQIFRHEFMHLMDSKISPAKEEVKKSLDPMVGEDSFSRWQLRKALTRTNTLLLKQNANVLNQYASIEEAIEGNAEVQAAWEKIFKHELLKVVGLYPEEKEADLMEYVEKHTAENFANRLGNDKDFAAFLGGLNRYDRIRVESIIKSDLFARNYVEATISREKVPAMSPAQPGVTQKIRQTRLVRSSKVLTGAARFWDGLYSDTRYNRGLWAKISRDIVPFSEDFVQGHIRAIRRFPMAATIGYTWSAIVWNTALSRPMWFLNFLFTGATIIGPWSTVNRIMGKFGWKPASDWKSMVKYAAIGSFATFTGSIFVGLFQGDFMHAMAYAQEGVSHATKFCEQILTGK